MTIPPGVKREKGEWGPWRYLCPVCGTVYSGSRREMIALARRHSAELHQGVSLPTQRDLPGIGGAA